MAYRSLPAKGPEAQEAGGTGPGNRFAGELAAHQACSSMTQLPEPGPRSILLVGFEAAALRGNSILESPGLHRPTVAAAGKEGW